MPSITPASNTRRLDERHMRIEPALHEVARRVRPSMGCLVMRATLLTVRIMACAGVVGITLFSVAHADKWLARGHGGSHAADTRLMPEPVVLPEEPNLSGSPPTAARP